MNKHEWKPGDKFEGVAEAATAYGDIFLDGCVIKQQSVTFIPDHSDWIGKPASELPEGTVCDVDMGMWVTRVVCLGGRLHWVNPDDSPALQMHPTNCPVIRIHKLGEQRPETLAEEKDGIAWADEIFVRWRRGGETLAYEIDEPWDIFVDESRPEQIKLANRKLLGPIEGIKIGGKMYGEGE